MQARDIMTRDVVCVAPDASVLDVAELLVTRRISAVPVIRDGALVGLVSEASLMHREEIGTARDPADRPWWIRLFKGEQSPEAYVESHARTVQDIMSDAVVSVTEDTSVAELARLFDKHAIKRVPVVDGNSLVGIVSRSDLIRALVAKHHESRPSASTSDDEILRAVLHELAPRLWWRQGQSDVSVSQGVVHYSGLVDSSEEVRAARVAAENVPGVRGVEDHRLNAGESIFGYW